MSQYKSLLGLNELAVDSLDIANLDLTNTNIVGLYTDRIPEDADPVNLYFTDGRFDTRLATKSTTDLKEGKNLYYTEQRVRDNDEVKASTQHRSNTSNPHQTSLYNLIDTNISAPTVGQYLTYNDVDGKWRNTTIGSIDTLSDVVITAPIAANSYLTYNSINWVNKTFPINVDETGNISMGGYLNITGVNLLNTKDVDDWITEHIANNAKVSADGSINTHSDVLITGTPSDNQLLIYSTGQWRNVASPFLRLDGTASMTAGLNMGGFNITNVGTVDGIDVSTLDTNVVKLTGDQTIAGNKIFTTYLGIKDSNPSNTGRLFFNYNNNTGAIYSAEPNGATGYPLNIVGSSILFAPTTGSGITLTGNVFNFNSTTAISGLPAPFYDGDASTKAYTDTKLAKDGTTAMTGSLNMGGFNITNVNLVDGIDVSVLDTSVVKLTGDQTIAGTKTFSDKITIALDKPIIMGRTTRGLAAYTGGLELYGTSGVAGPHIQAFTTANPNYPCFQLINNGHSNTALKFDCYWDGAVNDKSSFLTSNFMISKGTNLVFQYAAGVAVGSNITFNTAMEINSTSGLLTTKAITASGAITANGGLNMGGQSITNVNLVDGIDVSVLDSNVVKITGDQTIAGNKKFTSTIEVRGATGPTAFDGIGIAFDTATNIGEITAQKIATATYYPIQITGSYVELYSGDNVIATATGTTLSLNNRKITNLATPTLSTDGATKGYADTLDGQNVKLTGDQTITGIKIFNGSRNDIRALNLLSQADFNNVDIINGGNITYNGARILNQNGGDIFFSQTTGDWQSFLYTLNTDSSGTADQRGYLFTNVAFDVKGAGLYISKLLDNKSASSDIVRFNNAGGMRFYGALDMNSNNITSAGTITSTAGITTTTLTASDNIVVGAGKKIFVDRNANANNKLVVFDGNNNSTTEFQGFGTANATLIYNIPSANSHVFYVSGTTELFRINNTTITASKSITANAGISVVNSTADIRGEARTGSHATPVGLYVTANLGQSSGGVEFRHSNGTQGVGFGYNSVYATGSSTDQELNFYARGSSQIYARSAMTCSSTLTANGTITYSPANNSITLGTRSGFANEPMILLRSGNSANNRGFFGFSGTNVYAWCTTNSNGEPSGNYNFIAAGGAWGYSSDRRLKTDIKTLECSDCCEKLMKLNCCSYYLKTDEKKEKKNCGFIADEVKKIFPEFVDNTDMKIGEDENIEGITYTSFIPILVSAFQHLSEQNKNLSNDIADLKKQLAELRNNA